MARKKRKSRNARQPQLSGAEQLTRWIDRYNSIHGRGAKAYLADLIGSKWGTVHKIATEQTRPTVPTAKALELATDGDVSWQALVG